MISLYKTLLAAICCLCLQRLVSANEETVNRAKRHIIGSSFGNPDGPIVLNHMLKQPILSFGPWFSPSRSKRFSQDSVDYADLDAFYPQPVLSPQPISTKKLRRALRQHRRLVLNI